MSEENPIIEAEQSENYFDHDDADVLYDAYMILFDYGYDHDNLALLRDLIAETTHHRADALVRNADRMIEDDEDDE